MIAKKNILRRRPAIQFVGFGSSDVGPGRNGSCRQRCRDGATMVELVVAAVVLAAIMTVVATLCVRVNLIWKDIGHRRVAVGELSNQLERITRLSPVEAKQQLESIVATDVCARTLSDPRITGTLVEDELGVRVVLQINWKRRHPGNPIELVGWLRPSSQQPEQQDVTILQGVVRIDGKRSLDVWSLAPVSQGEPGQ